MRFCEAFPYRAEAIQCLQWLRHIAKKDGRDLKPAEFTGKIDLPVYVQFAGARPHNPQHVRRVDTEYRIAAKAQQFEVAPRQAGLLAHGCRRSAGVNLSPAHCLSIYESLLHEGDVEQVTLERDVLVALHNEVAQMHFDGVVHQDPVIFVPGRRG